MTPIPPHLQANIDQTRAQLRELTRWVREHKAGGCKFPTACPGDDTLTWIETHHYDVGAVLALALIDRATPQLTPADLVDSVAGTLLACNADVITGPDGSAIFVDEPHWQRVAHRVVDELLRIGAVDGGGS